MIAVFGATSGIARAVAEAWLQGGENLVLIGRSREALDALARDLEVVSGRKVPVFPWDVSDFAAHKQRFAELAAAHALKGLFMAAGVMYSPDECAEDPARTVETFQANLAGPAVVIDLFAAYFAAQAGSKKAPEGGRFLSVLTSVAGDRGRPSNYHYGASKAGLSTFLEGLRGRLHGKGVLVQDVRPGPIRTRMTAHLRSALMAEPAKAAWDIVQAVEDGMEVVYTPGYWSIIMAVIRSIPAFLFKRLKL